MNPAPPSGPTPIVPGRLFVWAPSRFARSYREPFAEAVVAAASASIYFALILTSTPIALFFNRLKNTVPEAFCRDGASAIGAAPLSVGAKCREDSATADATEA